MKFLQFIGSRKMKYLEENYKLQELIGKTKRSERLVLTSNTVSASSQRRALKSLIKGINCIFVYDGIHEWGNFFNNPTVKKKGYSRMLIEHCNIILVPGKKISRMFIQKGVPAFNHIPLRMRAEVQYISESKPRKKILLASAKRVADSKTDLQKIVDIYNEIISTAKLNGYEIVYRIGDPELEQRLSIRGNDLKSRLEKQASECVIAFTTPSSIEFVLDQCQAIICEINVRLWKSTQPSLLSISCCDQVRTLFKEVDANPELLNFQNAAMLAEYGDAIEIDEVLRSTKYIKPALTKLQLDEITNHFYSSRYTIDLEPVMRRIRYLGFIIGKLKK